MVCTWFGNQTFVIWIFDRDLARTKTKCARKPRQVCFFSYFWSDALHVVKKSKKKNWKKKRRKRWREAMHTNTRVSRRTRWWQFPSFACCSNSPVSEREREQKDNRRYIIKLSRAVRTRSSRVASSAARCSNADPEVELAYTWLYMYTHRFIHARVSQRASRRLILHLSPRGRRQVGENCIN